jgi:NNP family nitrate/nitrite transporter-like MFS transporter
MFAPNCIGTANATTAGWGNMGGGVTQIVMPIVFSFFAVTLGLGEFWGWRISMVASGLGCMLAGIAYYALTQDTPGRDPNELLSLEPEVPGEGRRGSFRRAARNRRVWLLFVAYAACFGVELTMDNVAALYFTDYFGLGMRAAGLAAGSLGLLHIFARTLGGYVSDRFGERSGLGGRVNWLFVTLLVEGIALIAFSRATALVAAIPMMLCFGVFMKMAEGATFAVVPFVDKKALGSVAGIVGAGGNAGAVAAGFLFRGAVAWPTALLVLGAIVSAASFLVLAVRFSPMAERDAAIEHELELAPTPRHGHVLAGTSA